MTTIHLGYEVGTGAPVAIPLGHMAVCGQSQQSGKTTTLEALISRSGARAVAFVTKRGEASFSGAGGGRVIAPYFTERADWQFVESILESTMRQRLKFERAWVVRATKGARALADVRRNVRTLQASAKRSMDADIYMLLGEYLDLVVPLLATLPASSTLDLAPGLNVMQLDAYPSELQALIIRSALAWIYEHERDVIAVIPEAWEFVPQSRGAPVKLAATDLARKGAGLRNFLWLDSQDIAGVEKEIVRQMSVWLLGVQREANEVKRTLQHIPAGVKKPRPDDIAALGVGEFWACWHGHAVRTYVQPAWLSPQSAAALALGGGARPRPPAGARLKSAPAPATPPPPAPDDTDQTEEGDDMSKEAEAKLDRVIALLEAQHSAVPGRRPAAPADVVPALPSLDEEALYQRIRARLVADAPALIKLVTVKNEIEVTRERKIITMDGSTLRGRLAALIAGGFFAQGKSNRETVNELARTGRTAHDSNVSKELAELLVMGFLFRTPGNRWQQTTEARVRIVDADGDRSPNGRP